MKIDKNETELDMRRILIGMFHADRSQYIKDIETEYHWQNFYSKDKNPEDELTDDQQDLIVELAEEVFDELMEDLKC